MNSGSPEPAALSGRVALVTGAGRGIGREIALGLARAGASIAVVARTSEEIEAVASEIEAAGGTAFAVTADVGDPGGAARAAAAAASRLGDISVLINNAAVVGPLGPTTGLEPSEIQAALAINVVGPIALAAAVLPAMHSGGWGRIVNVSSGIVATPEMMIGGTVYAATKAALEAHTLNLAAELDGTGITANVYRPGIVDTSMQAGIRGRSPEEIGSVLHERFSEMHASGSLISPLESARALLERVAGTATGEIWTVGD